MPPMSLDCLTSPHLTSPHPPAGRRDLPTPISMASIHIVAAQSFILSIPTPAMGPNKALIFHANARRRSSWRGGGSAKIGSLWGTVRRREEWGLAPVADELDVIPAQSGGATDRRLVAAATKEEEEEESIIGPMDWKINAAIVLAAGSFAITKLVTIDSDYWHVSPVIW